MEDFSYIDFKQGGLRKRIEDNEISICFTKACKVISFSKNVSQEIKDRGLKYVRLVKSNLTSEFLFVISNDTKGIKLSNLDNKNYIRIHCIDLIIFLRKTFSLHGEYERLFIGKNIANFEEFMTFKLTKALEK